MAPKYANVKVALIGTSHKYQLLGNPSVGQVADAGTRARVRARMKRA
jgi:hypothetical protein